VAENGLARRSYSQTGSESGASFAAGRQANGSALPRVSHRHPGEWLDKVWEP
jgi:hypothetical protein